jgi:hypothetical protein
MTQLKEEVLHTLKDRSRAAIAEGKDADRRLADLH